MGMTWDDQELEELWLLLPQLFRPIRRSIRFRCRGGRSAAAAVQGPGPRGLDGAGRPGADLPLAKTWHSEGLKEAAFFVCFFAGSGLGSESLLFLAGSSLEVAEWPKQVAPPISGTRNGVVSTVAHIQKRKAMKA